MKPFSLPELMARVKAILRRTAPDRVAEVLKIGDIELDRAAHASRAACARCGSGPTEFRLLEFLMESSGRVLSRTQLLDGVWGRDAFVDERTVDVHIGRLRKALIRGNERDPIRTVRSAGYVFGDTRRSADPRITNAPEKSGALSLSGSASASSRSLCAAPPRRVSRRLDELALAAARLRRLEGPAGVELAVRQARDLVLAAEVEVRGICGSPIGQRQLHSVSVWMYLRSVIGMTSSSTGGTKASAS